MKKALKTSMFILVTMFTLLSLCVSASAVLKGDIDGDGSLTSSDARFVLRASVGLETLSDNLRKIADADGDGTVTASDARLVLRASVGLEVLTDAEHKHEYKYETVKEPTCTTAGSRKATCKTCSYSAIETIKATGHTMGEWKTVADSTAQSQGYERSKCSKCSYYKDRVIPVKPAVYYITVTVDSDNSYKTAVAADGKYSLSVPSKEGYIFKGWADNSGKSFASSGTVKENKTVRAVWELDGTDTLAKLIKRAGAGAQEILITGNITVNAPIFVPYETHIYSDGNYALTRAKDYDGDIFVVGSDKDGNKTVLENKKAVLTLGGGKGMLTVDGNRDNVTTPVNGTLVFVADSSECNIYDGVKLINNNKTGNVRSYRYDYVYSTDTIKRIGGAAVINLSSTVNMYGGIISNNAVATAYTETPKEDGSVSHTEDNGCGGAVYNKGTFNMLGGTISSNEALRGGGVYNDRFCYFIAGEISDNLAHTYGGAVSSSSSSNANMFTGYENGTKKMVFKNNRSIRAGGALYSNTSSPIILYPNTEIINNRSDSSGGAVYTAGPLVAEGVRFIGNTCEYSGGAIYHHYTKAEFKRRYMLLTSCTFEDNKGGLGGAVILSSSGSVTNEGTYAEITDCVFTNNQAIVTSTNPGNGGAVYVTRYSDAIIKNCEFSENTAVKNAGALAIHSNATVDISDCSFNKNTANLGGAVYTSSESVVDMINIEFNENSAIITEEGAGGNGGAVYYAVAKLTLKNVNFKNNFAGNNAGAIYQNASTLKLDNTCKFSGNTAGNHGGALYLTYTNNEDGTKTGSVLIAENMTFEKNSALAGGAVSGRTNSDITLKNVKFIKNTTPDAAVSTTTGGGAIYSNNSKVNITASLFDGNTSGYYGGALRLDACDSVINNTEIANSTGGTGGAVYASGESLKTKNLTLTGNKSALNGVMYIACREAEFDKLTATGNSGVNGGVLYAGKSSKIKLTDSALSGNTAKYGGTLYVTANSDVEADNCKFIGNSIENGHGGAVYVYGASFKAHNNSVFEKNTSTGNGGAVGAFDIQNETTLEKTPSAVEISDCTFNENTGACGGAVYFNDSGYSISNCSFTKNTATSESYGGGAVYNTGATGTIDKATFTENTALRGGAVAIYTNSSVELSDVTATGNIALSDGGAIYANKCKVNLTNDNIVLIGNKAKNGGAVYLHNSEAVISDVTFNKNTATANGGAVDIVGSRVTLSGTSSFTDNSAKNHGGAVYVTYINASEDGKTPAIPGSLTATNGTFTGNRAIGGGAVSIRTGCEAAFDGTSFTGNTVTGYEIKADGTGAPDGNAEGGGAVYVGYGKLTLTNVTAKNNAAMSFVEEGTNNIIKSFGGAVDGASADITVTGGTFSGNKASVGGAIHAMSKSDLTITNASFNENESDYTKLDYDNTVGGGAVNIIGGTLTMDTVTLDGNKTGYYGGALMASGTSVDISDSIFTNSEGATGAALHFKNKSDVTISDTQITDNTSSANGVVYANNSTVTVTSLTASKNTASKGGLFYVSNANSVISVIESTITNNSATSNGGIVYAENASVSFSGGTVSKNSAKNGGVAYSDGAKISFTDTTVTENTASSSGGAVYSEAGELAFTGTSVSMNSAVSGGAVFLNENAVANINNSEITENTATSNGGSVHSTLSSVNLDSAVFSTNNSGNYGGAVYLNRSDITLKDTSFSKNTAVNHGGAIYLAGADMTASGNNTFNENSSAKHGGAVYVVYYDIEEESGTTRLPATLIMENGTFTANTALGGGAVSIRSACEATFNGTSFVENTVSGFSGEADGDGEGGGAIYVGYGKLSLTNVTANGNIADESITEGTNEVNKSFGGAVDGVSAEITVTGGSYSGNKASAGGAFHLMTKSSLHIKDALVENNESVYVNSDYTSDIGGGAIKASGGMLTIDNTTLSGNKTNYYGGAVLASGVNAEIKGSSIIEASEGGTGSALYFKNQSTVTANGITVRNNTSTANGVIYANNSTLDITALDASGNKAKNGGVIYVSNANTRVTINDSVITDNSATANGGVVYTENATVSFTDCNISDNTAKNGGAAYTDRGNVNFTDSEITSNSATNGGVTYSLNGNVSFTGGEITGNSATTGGAVYSELSTISFTGGKVAGNSATTGGAIYTTDSILTVKDTEFTENTASNNGGAVYARHSELSIEDAEFNSNSAKNHGGAADIAGSTAVLTGNNSFTANTAGNHGGAVYVVYLDIEEEGTDKKTRIPSIFTMEDGTFTGNTALGGGAVSIRSACEATFDGTAFSGNTVSGFSSEADGDGEGGGAIYVGFGELYLTNAVFNGNIANETVNTEDNTVNNSFGGAIDSVSSTITITDGSFDGNKATSGGAIHLFNKSVLTADGTSFINNVSTGNTSSPVDSSVGGGAILSNKSTVTLSGAVLSGNKTNYYGGAVHGIASTLTIDQNSAVTNTSGTTGAALYFRDSCNVTLKDITVIGNTSSSNGVIYTNSGTLTAENVTANKNNAASGGVLYVSGGSVKAYINGGVWSENTANTGGSLFINTAKVWADGVTFSDNSSTLGGAVYISKGEFTADNTEFINNRSAKNSEGKNGNGGAVTIAAGTFASSENIKFSNNTAEAHGGAVYVSYATNTDDTKIPGILNITGGIFENNTASIGGAISARTSCITTLNGTVLKDNTATDVNGDGGGGAIYTNDNTFTLSGVTATGNSTGFYGGVLTGVNANVTVNNNSSFISNLGKTGPVFNFRGASKVTINSISLTDNKVSNGNGIIYMTSSGTLDITGLTATGNTNTNGGVFYISGSASLTIKDSVLSGNTATGFGGAIDFRSSGTLTVSETTISGNTAKNGGAMNLAGSGAVTIENSDILGNTATASGGALHITGSGKVTVSENTEIKENTAPTAGAVHLDAGAEASFSSSLFEKNSSTGGDGGAILVSDSSDEGTAATKLTLSGVTFNENTASAKGGAISTDTASPNIEINASSCIFSKNKALGAGGGAVEIQNGNCSTANAPEKLLLTFTNCKFTENTSKTTGAAVEIRTGSCAKFDGIEATGNNAGSGKQNGGVFYVTSNHSRLYLTGAVTQNGNAASKGTFAFLYNNKYSNPPRIYTTHSNTADWVSGVTATNDVLITYDMASMP